MSQPGSGVRAGAAESAPRSLGEAAHDYLAQVNSENLAKLDLILHQVQWLLAQYSYRNLSGN